MKLEVFCEEYGIFFFLIEVWEKGGDGGFEFVDKVIVVVESGEVDYKCIYDDVWLIEEKLEVIVMKVYGGIGVEFFSKV